jgi:NAD(P)-dependent dehydrogenase (short-subunit alcohol dehydrogenase family)
MGERMESVVIGAGSGMGAAARRLAARGPVLVVDRNREPLVQLAEQIGGGVEVAVCDVTNPDQVDSLFTGQARCAAPRQLALASCRCPRG